MDDKPSMHANEDMTYEKTCDECGSTFPASDVVTVQWANVVFCGDECRQRWTTKQGRPGGSVL